MASLPRRRKPSVPVNVVVAPFILPTHRSLARESGRSEAAFGFKSFMHFSYYLMIAALTLVGFEVIHALYQLAAFVL